MRRLSAPPLVLGLLLTLCACADPSEAARLRQALDPTTPIARGLSLCRTLSDPTQAGQCGVQVLDRKPDIGEGDCVTLGADVWADECRFNVAERLAAQGEVTAATEICDRIRFSRPCNFHLVREQARLSVDEPPATAEARIALFAQATIAPDAARLFWGERFRSTQLLGRPADAASCEALAAPAPCHEAFTSMWTRAIEAVSRPQACARLQAGRPLLTMGNGEPSFVPTQEALTTMLKACPPSSAP
ncbi:hypothetical protein L6R49_05250 [Myxococcota bacterium]|nr:hypothetical protein [Myxococcota bacterium]